MTEFPPTGSSDTSKEAARSLPSRGADLRARVLAYIVSRGSEGATCWEAERALAFMHQTCSPRIWELRRAGRVADSGQRRMTGSGRQAVVWVVLPEGAAPAAMEAARRIITLPRALTNPVTLPGPVVPPVAAPSETPARSGYGPGSKCCAYHILDGTEPACRNDFP